ncbi:ParB domain protein nuclease [Rhodobacteraceae bacterium KLH11]|nr:ParB domain protein nuclease [Rhodobacteraceae bacterium KLH11]
MLERARKGHLSECWIKRELKPDAVSTGDRRAQFVGLDAYKEAGGRVTTDLFADRTTLDDPAILQDLFNKKLAAEARSIRQAQGWQWAEVIDDDYFSGADIDKMNCARIYAEPGELTEEQTERYDELAELANGEVLDEEGTAELADLQDLMDGQFTDIQKDHAGIVVYFSHSGDPVVTDGLIKPEDWGSG